MESSFELGKPILVDFLIKNSGYQPVTIALSEKPYYNFNFLMKSIQNKVISEQNQFYLEKVDGREGTKKIAKTITLGNQQFYGERFDLTKMFKLNRPGHYVIQGFFTPVPGNLRAGIQINSKVIQVEIRESPYQKQITLQEQIREDRELQKIRNPYDTINFMLKARVAEKWQRYFQYIDLHKLIRQFPIYYKKYQTIRPSRRQAVIHEFREYLKIYLFDLGYGNLTRFQIYKSVIENEKKEARVMVKLFFSGDGMSFFKKYHFILFQRNRRWYVRSWIVEN